MAKSGDKIWESEVLETRERRFYGNLKVCCESEGVNYDTARRFMSRRGVRYYHGLGVFIVERSVL